MKKYFKRILAIALCFTLCFGNSILINGANESGVNFSLTLDKPVIEQSEESQTVVMTLKADSAITAGAIGFDINVGSGITVKDVSAGDRTGDGDWQLEGNKVNWISADAENVENIQTIVSVTLEVPANIATGEYTVGISNLEITKDYIDTWENGGSASTILTVIEPVSGYTAGISSDTTAVIIDDQVIVNVAVKNDKVTQFAAGQLVFSYDSSKLDFVKCTNAAGEVQADENGNVLKLVDFGGNKAFEDAVYVLEFKAIASGDVDVTLTSAAFTTAEDAVTEDLQEAQLLSDKVSITISEKPVNVTIDSALFDGADKVDYGADYTFKLAGDSEFYEYSKITATMGDDEATVEDNGNGTYTVKAVTAALKITATRTEKSYGVTFDGDGKADTEAITGNAGSATYKADYIFNIPATTNDYVYSVTGITIGGNQYNGYENDETTYTIPGADIKGAIVITVAKTENPDGYVSVEITGNGSGQASGEGSVQKGRPYVLTVAKEAGYVYTVTATMGGAEATVKDNGDGTYTIESVTANISFTVTRSVDTSGVSVSEYIQLDGMKMWLIKNTTAVATGKVPTYGGEEMFWSDKYNAYCYLVVSNAEESTVLSAAQAALEIGTLAGTKKAVAYDYDVNGTGKVDASDAQLVWNMYMAKAYTNFESVEMSKFLEADVNGDKAINLDDAAAIIDEILGSGN